MVKPIVDGQAHIELSSRQKMKADLPLSIYLIFFIDKVKLRLFGFDPASGVHFTRALENLERRRRLKMRLLQVDP
jgi:hypothetical protein